MCTEGMDGGRRFFKCPRVRVVFSTNCVLNIFVIYCITYDRFFFQTSYAPENYGFVRCVDPPLIYPHAEYIYYLQNHIFDLEMDVSSGNNDEEDDNNKCASSPEEQCTNPYCNCPCHKNKGPPASPPPPAPPATGGYYAIGAT